MHMFVLMVLLVSTYLLLAAKRFTALVRSFQYQSAGLFLATFLSALSTREKELYVVAGLVLALKVVLIPRLLTNIVQKIKAHEDLGLLVNPQLSLVSALVLTYLSWFFARCVAQAPVHAVIAVAFFVVLSGLFLMIFRLTALAQVVGLCVMENGLFLLAAAVSGGMPFFVEIAIFFDVFVSVMIMGFFVYRISRLFTHIDVDKLSRLKG